MTIGDAFDEAAVQQCMEGCVAAITTLGGKTEDGAKRVDYFGNSNVIEQVSFLCARSSRVSNTSVCALAIQAGILGVERIILVTR